MIQEELFKDFYSIPEGVETQECVKCDTIKPITAFRERISREGKGMTVRRLTTCYECEKLNSRLMNYLEKDAPPKPDRCECCGEETDTFHLDHCHATGTFRGWLCINCNVGIGRLGDNAVGIKKALDYLLNAALSIEDQ